MWVLMVFGGVDNTRVFHFLTTANPNKFGRTSKNTKNMSFIHSTHNQPSTTCVLKYAPGWNPGRTSSCKILYFGAWKSDFVDVYDILASFASIGRSLEVKFIVIHVILALSASPGGAGKKTRLKCGGAVCGAGAPPT